MILNPAGRLRHSLRKAETVPGRRNRKRAIRHDKFAANFLSGVVITAALIFWL